MRNKKLKIFVVIVSFILVFTILCLNNSIMFQGMEYKETRNKIEVAQSEQNFSISTSFPKLMWIEGQLSIEINTSLTGDIRCEISESGINNEAFNPKELILDLESTNDTQQFRVTIHPKFFTLPGMYSFDLRLSYIDSGGNGTIIRSESFESILGLGYLSMTIIFLTFGIGLIIVITKKTEVTQTESSYEEESYSESYDAFSDAPAGKIKCPKCKKFIQEGLTFCPECGHRIPEYLRYNPNSSSGPL